MVTCRSSWKRRFGFGVIWGNGVGFMLIRANFHPLWKAPLANLRQIYNVSCLEEKWKCWGSVCFAALCKKPLRISDATRAKQCSPTWHNWWFWVVFVPVLFWGFLSSCVFFHIPHFHPQLRLWLFWSSTICLKSLNLSQSSSLCGCTFRKCLQSSTHTHTQICDLSQFMRKKQNSRKSWNMR